MYGSLVESPYIVAVYRKAKRYSQKDGIQLMSMSDSKNLVYPIILNSEGLAVNKYIVKAGIRAEISDVKDNLKGVMLDLKEVKADIKGLDHRQIETEKKAIYLLEQLVIDCGKKVKLEIDGMDMIRWILRS